MRNFEFLKGGRKGPFASGAALYVPSTTAPGCINLLILPLSPSRDVYEFFSSRLDEGKARGHVFFFWGGWFFWVKNIIFWHFLWEERPG